ncbi:hypothetical protein Godav_024143 [Gossypium davidsonii]|uniref:Uncharacterized protein n=1 Tax=Gossypium davidsonii TaxID=34287 RepID=A0A7J8SUW2_GOSDV|nr:hypothetical protein [Gossypium davidsonii]
MTKLKRCFDSSSLTKAFVRVKGRTASLLCTKLFKLERLIFCSSFLRFVLRLLKI